MTLLDWTCRNPGKYFGGWAVVLVASVFVISPWAAIVGFVLMVGIPCASTFFTGEEMVD